MYEYGSGGKQAVLMDNHKNIESSDLCVAQQTLCLPSHINETLSFFKGRNNNKNHQMLQPDDKVEDKIPSCSIA